DFPNSPPKCILLTRIFHPNVSASGDICVNTLKKDWKPTYGITHILTVIRCLLIYPNPESALDEEAGKMLLDDYEGYCKRARMMTSIHAARGGKPVEFQDQKKAEPEDPLVPSLLDGPGPSGTLQSTRTTIANPSSTTSVPTQLNETITATSKRAATDKPQ
ncbi:9139_t:CDS:2, partial [Acaulospora colombiana]